MSAASRPVASINWSGSLGLRVSKSEVSRICQALDEHVDAFRSRPLEGAYPYLFLDAKVEKVRDGGRVVTKALAIRLADINTSAALARERRFGAGT